MNRRVASVSFVATLLLSAAGLSLVSLAAANPMWYVPIIVINNDGSVVPRTEFIRQDGTVYTLTTDFSQKYAIKIQCSNIVFDGAGHTMDGSAIYYGPANDGLSLESVTNVTVKDIQVYDFGFNDILIENCSRCRLFRVAAERVSASGGENVVSESIFGSFSLGVGSSENLVVGNKFSYLGLDGEANIFLKNNITESFSASGSRNSVIANRIRWLYLYGVNNKYCANEIDWFRISEASNLFHDNNFINLNPPELAIDGERGPFFWDNGEEGNYWRRAQTYYTGLDADGDGLGDSPYTIDARYFDADLNKNVVVACGMDNYPLMPPFDIDDVSIWLPEWAGLNFESAQSVLILSLQNANYTTADVPLNFTLLKPAKLVQYSLDGQANVTISGNTTLTDLASGSHNLTLYIDDSLGNTRPSETIYFTIAEEPEPFPTLLVASVSAASAAVVSVGLLLYFRKRSH